MHLEKDKETNIENEFICGNHEMIMCQALHPTANTYERQMWLENGGAAVCRELNMTYEAVRETGILQPWYNWVETHTKVWIHTTDYVFTHGGTQIDIPIKDQNPDACMWHRPAPGYYEDCRYMCIHGHSSELGDGKNWGKPFNDENRFCVDTGSPWSGVLTAVVLHHVRDDEKIRYLVAKGPKYEVTYPNTMPNGYNKLTAEDVGAKMLP